MIFSDSPAQIQQELAGLIRDLKGYIFRIPIEEISTPACADILRYVDDIADGIWRLQHPENPSQDD